jgi:hypothetical protein
MIIGSTFIHKDIHYKVVPEVEAGSCIGCIAFNSETHFPKELCSEFNNFGCVELNTVFVEDTSDTRMGHLSEILRYLADGGIIEVRGKQTRNSRFFTLDQSLNEIVLYKTIGHFTPAELELYINDLHAYTVYKYIPPKWYEVSFKPCLCDTKVDGVSPNRIRLIVRYNPEDKTFEDSDRNKWFSAIPLTEEDVSKYIL